MAVKNPKFIPLLLTGVAICIAAAVGYKSLNDKAPSADAEAIEATERFSDGLEEVLSQAKQALADEKANEQAANVSTAISTAYTDTAMSDRTEPQTEQEKRPEDRTPEEIRAAVQAVETEVFDNANRLFEEEEVDLDWGPDYEQSLSDMFVEFDGLDRVSVSEIQCRSTMCQIIVFTPQGYDADYFTSVFYEALGAYQGGELKTTAAIARNMANGITAVYVSRKNHTLKFY
jgi:hypothetical protein